MKINAFLIAVLMFSKSYSQQDNKLILKQPDLIGVWQINSEIVGSGLNAYFQFYPKGKFIYNTNGYDELNPLRSISGEYKIDHNILYLKIREYKHLAGYKIVESSPAFQFGHFILDGGKVVISKQIDSSYSEHEVKITKSKKVALKKCISIDSEIYFKVAENPDKFN
jgi:hypothetical protein